MAARFNLDPGASTILVLGEGVPYLSAQLNDTYQHIAVIAITIGDAGSAPEEVRRIPVPGSSGGDEITRTVRRHLRNRIHPLDAGRVQAFVWPPAEECAPSWCDAVRTGVIAALRDLQSEVATIGSFGALWIGNALRRTVVTDTRGDVTIRGPLVVAGAGPSLPEAIRFVQGARQPAPAVIAASSAVAPLIARGVVPDLVFHSDAGFWAQRYRREVPPEAVPTALPLRAAPRPGSGGRDENAIFLRNGWFGESLAPDRAEWSPGVEAPTVVGEMIEYVLRYVPPTRIDLVGVDLCSRDLRSHAAKHENDRYLATTAHRLLPEHTIRALRSGYLTDPAPLRWRDGSAAFRTEALHAFAAHLDQQIARLQTRHTLEDPVPSPARPSLLHRDRPAGTTGPQTERETSAVTVRTIRRPSRSDRLRHAIRTLSAWEERLDAPSDDIERRDIVLHLAPVEALREHIDDGGRVASKQRARAGIARFRRWLRDG